MPQQCILYQMSHNLSHILCAHEFRMDFKILRITDRAFSVLALVYISQHLSLYMPECTLKSPNKCSLQVHLFKREARLSKGPRLQQRSAQLYLPDLLLFINVY